MKPTRVSSLVGLAVALVLLAYMLAAAEYGALPKLPTLAPLSLALLAVGEGLMAKVISDRLARRRDGRGHPVGRPLHPLQVARAAVLAKASSVLGALIAGAYAGFFAWTFPRRAQTATFSDDARVSAVCALAGGALVVAALLLERSCRLPDRPEAPDGLGSAR